MNPHRRWRRIERAILALVSAGQAGDSVDHVRDGGPDDLGAVVNLDHLKLLPCGQ